MPSVQPSSQAPRDRHRSSVAPAQATSVLPTLNDDGSRRWLTPRVSRGRFLSRRRIVAYTLIAIFALLPLARINGKPVILLDIAARRFHILGATFYPTDTLLLAVLMVAVFLTIFWVTAMFGRIWCGWACPQTVYMEFLFRPIERLFEGAPGRAKRGWLQKSGAGAGLKFLAYLVCALLLAHTFLAYFVSWHDLRTWVFGSPTKHWSGFLTVAIVTGAMLFDFAYFREQVCLLACPYGRFQSVLLDRHSLIIGYDQNRGEPRGARRRDLALPVVGADSLGAGALGDCVDCRMCVTTCPTGIDIRNGLQMECVGCAQCIDACDAVMDRIKRPRGLIRYSSKAGMGGQKFRFLRARVVLYPVVLLALASLFTFVLMNTGVAEVIVLRGVGQPFTIAPDGSVSNGLRIKIVNRLDRPGHFTLALAGSPGETLTTELSEITIPPGQSLTVPAQIHALRETFQAGRSRVMITINGPEQFSRTIPFTLLGPAGGGNDEHSEHDKEHHP